MAEMFVVLRLIDKMSFNIDLKWSTDLAARMFDGSWFHRFGAADKNPRLP